MGAPVIEVERVGKKFSKSLKRSMLYGAVDIFRSSLGQIPDSSRLREDEFWAVNDVSFNLCPGETLGLIGPNGSGKTTLLRMLNGIFMPDKGRIRIQGRVGALIQVGAGFHPMLSGRENIYINASILGMPKNEIDAKFDDIVAFADIGDFLDAPVKHYSSGMFVRLGFAVAIHCEPDILLIDEILAVGDTDFQIKCYQKMHEIKQRGTTIVLVSHNEYTIREQTQKALYLQEGRLVTAGPSEKVISAYLKDMYEHKSRQQKVAAGDSSGSDKKGNIVGLEFFNGAAQPVTFVESGEELNLTVRLSVRENINDPVIGVNFYDENGLVFSANNKYDDIHFDRFDQGDIKVKIRIPELHLPMKNYLCSVSLAEEADVNIIDIQTKAYKLVIGRAPNARGLVKLDTQWALETC